MATQVIDDIYKMSIGKYSICLKNNEKIENCLKGRFDDMNRDATFLAILMYQEGKVEGCVYPEWIPLTPFRSDYEDPFLSTLVFFDSLYEVSCELNGSVNKAECLRNCVEKLNRLLPAAVYIPFTTGNLREYSLLHIRTEETLVYSTKGKTPFRLTFELFCPHEELRLSNPEEPKEIFKELRDLKDSKEVKEIKEFKDIRDFKEIKDPKEIKDSKEIKIIKERKNSRDFLDLIKLPERIPRKQSNMSASSLDIFGPDFSSVQEYLTELQYIKTVPEEDNTFLSHSMFSDKLSMVYGTEGVDNEKNFIYESFENQEARVKNSSVYGNLLTWKMVNVIVKTGDDLRQEQLAIQIMTYFNQIFKEKNLKLWLYPYEIIPTHKLSGIIECVSNAVSIDYLKKNLPSSRKTLKDYFHLNFGSGKTFERAQQEFMKSLAGYSLACFILNLKDRHNGNILIDTQGHIVHIDFGFMLSNSPGGNMNFESAPFKLTEEFEELLGGRHSVCFNRFRRLCVQGFLELSKKAEQIILMVEMMRNDSEGNLPCFVAGHSAIEELRNRLLPFAEVTKTNGKKYINQLIDTSLDHWTTRWYDRVQYFFQGILY